VPRKDDPNVTSRASPKNDSYVSCVTDEDDEGDGDHFGPSDEDSELFEYASDDDLVEILLRECTYRGELNDDVSRDRSMVDCMN